MGYVDSVVKEIDALSNEFKTVSESQSRDEFDRFGWKCIDFVSEIKTDTPYSKEERFTLKNALLNLKGLALRLGMFKQYLDTLVETKTESLSDSRVRTAA